MSISHPSKTMRMKVIDLTASTTQRRYTLLVDMSPAVYIVENTSIIHGVEDEADNYPQYKDCPDPPTQRRHWII